MHKIALLRNNSTRSKLVPICYFIFFVFNPNPAPHETWVKHEVANWNYLYTYIYIYITKKNFYLIKTFIFWTHVSRYCTALQQNLLKTNGFPNECFPDFLVTSTGIFFYSNRSLLRRNLSLCLHRFISSFLLLISCAPSCLRM